MQHHADLPRHELTQRSRWVRCHQPPHSHQLVQVFALEGLTLSGPDPGVFLSAMAAECTTVPLYQPGKNWTRPDLAGNESDHWSFTPLSQPLAFCLSLKALTQSYSTLVDSNRYKTCLFQPLVLPRADLPCPYGEAPRGARTAPVCHCNAAAVVDVRAG